MNWNIVEGKWQEVAGAIKEKWGDLTDDEITQIAGKREHLEGLLKEKFGWAQEKVSQEVDELTTKVKEHFK